MSCEFELGDLPVQGLQEALARLTPGQKAPDAHVHTEGRVVACTALSKRLLFVTIAVVSGNGLEVKLIFKERDGFYSQAAITALAAELRVGDHVLASGFPERTGDSGSWIPDPLEGASGSSLEGGAGYKAHSIGPDECSVVAGEAGASSGAASSPSSALPLPLSLVLDLTVHVREMRRLDGEPLPLPLQKAEAVDAGEVTSGAPETAAAAEDEGSVGGTGGERRSRRSGNRARPANSNRGGALAAFIVQELGLTRAQLEAGGVLDVAGGAGALAFDLAHWYGVPCTVVDPVDVKLTPKQRRVVERRQSDTMAMSAHHGLPALPETTSPSTTSSPLSEDNQDRATRSTLEEVPGFPSIVRQYRGLFLWNAPHMDCLESLAQLSTTSSPAPPHRSEDPVLTIASLVHTASAIVGLHPDGATDALVDAAIAANKPFAVVPCCVFPNTFTARRTCSGGRVRSHEELCAYLCGKAPDIHVAALPFEGRNQVVFRRAAPS
ncbi:hypothetical protein CYMTET_38949 [Cymbomonas tetramitiformis]|uniref:Uncharacterized protein n=1 Tax=Cymbomonas tetramitiformis TaxID=36881 RepID=A0AAE0CB09_9CHLO|nr:hypothetical protein CYMTET_38949 [Cymbomonas tetramitiformis]